MNKLFVFDVESIGLHGEGFAVAGGIYTSTGAQREFCFACHPGKATGSDKDREWVMANTPLEAIQITHDDPMHIREAFWNKWLEAKVQGCKAAADCNWPVEANFLSACVWDKRERRNWEGPYPFIDIGSLIFAHGGDPLQSFPRIGGEELIHHPLHDARQSARIAFQFIRTNATDEAAKRNYEH